MRRLGPDRPMAAPKMGELHPVKHRGSAFGPRRNGFTLVELLAVLAIAAIVVALAIPAITSTLQSSQLTQAGQIVSSQIGLARQIAASRGVSVEVRMIQAPASVGASIPYYSAIQLFAVTSGSMPVGVSHAVWLPPGTIISGSQTVLSPYLAALQSSYPTMTLAGSTYNYISFRISPDGLVTPYADFSNLYVTVVPLQAAGATTTASIPNYVTVQINPATGTQLVYRP